MKNILTLALSLACIVPMSALAQNNDFTHMTLKDPKCGFSDVLKKIQYPYEQVISSYKTIVNERSLYQNKGAGVVYDIPVVFHVLYSSSTPQFNIADTLIKNQIDILNKAFRKQHPDTANTRAIFKSLSQDAEIQFHLATTDPNGNATTGITRTLSTRSYFGSSFGDIDSLERVKKTATGGVAPWPSTKYLNIWVANISDNQGDISVVAYATPPTNPLPGNWPAGAAAQLVGLIDGVVVLPHAVGSNNPIGSTALQGLYTKGRCLVHEVGHYLGLMHTFGSSGNSTSDCGTADTDDGLQDTPEQSLISLIQGSCPSNTKNSCGTGTNDQPDMWENYMDYTSDACQTMFTANQIAIMRSVMANQRNTLTSSSGIISIANKSLTVFPNPTSGNIKIDTKEKISTIEVFDLIGSTVLNIVATPNNTYDMSALPTGNYILKMTSQNGAVFTGKFVVVK